MADVRAIYAVGSSLTARLGRRYAEYEWPVPAEKPSCSFQVVGTTELAKDPALNKGIVFFLYRVQRSEHSRPMPADTVPTSLVLDLHYLMFPWGDNAQDEAYALAWTMRELASNPVLGAGDLVDGGFGEGDSVRISMGDLSNEDLMRLWDSLEPPYRLSVPYILRVVQLDPVGTPEARPVVARKLDFYQMPPGAMRTT